MALTDLQKKHLRRLGHALHPVVRVGQRGVSGSVVAELARALHDHELVKVQVRVGDRQARDAALVELARSTGSELAFQIGNVGLFYKKNNELNRILLPES